MIKTLIRPAYAVNFYRFLRDVIRNRRLLIDLIKNDFKSRYLQNYLGVLWGRFRKRNI
jgi:lipopolysaccharide transport system permease protein/teichoic acid transport system permease protein